MVEIAWLIPLLPVLAFALCIAFGERGPLRSAGFGIAAILASLALSLGVAAVVLVVVTVVASLVLIYSTGYMRGDPRFPLFYAYLSLFSAAMLGLVLASN